MNTNLNRIALALVASAACTLPAHAGLLGGGGGAIGGGLGGNLGGSFGSRTFDAGGRAAQNAQVTREGAAPATDKAAATKDGAKAGLLDAKQRSADAARKDTAVSADGTSNADARRGSADASAAGNARATRGERSVDVGGAAQGSAQRTPAPQPAEPAPSNGTPR